AYSEGVATEIDNEVRRIIEEAYTETEAILQENMDKLETVAQALMKVETLDGEQFEALYTGKVTADELEQMVREQEEETRRKNAEEARETARLREEAKAREEADLARYDTAYMDEDDPAAQEAEDAFEQAVEDEAAAQEALDELEEGAAKTLGEEAPADMDSDDPLDAEATEETETPVDLEKGTSHETDR
ncbi:MAG: hypothetical protein IIZ34_04015, partial [Eubacterium sp.]|nr:hypothetical protein [Eubacterium sp.]